MWVTHKSAIFGKYDLLLSLVQANGDELERFNLQKVMGGDSPPRVLGTWSTERDVLILLTAGDSHHASVEGFCLIGLKTDPATGTLEDRIEYF